MDLYRKCRPGDERLRPWCQSCAEVGVGGGVGRGDLGGAIEEFEDGGPFLFLRVEGFGGQRGVDLAADGRGGELGVDELGLDCRYHAGIIGRGSVGKQKISIS